AAAETEIAPGGTPSRRAGAARSSPCRRRTGARAARVRRRARAGYGLPRPRGCAGATCDTTGWWSLRGRPSRAFHVFDSLLLGFAGARVVHDREPLGDVEPARR